VSLLDPVSVLNPTPSGSADAERFLKTETMKLDEKYFVPFLAITAIGTAIVITFFTISNRESKQQAFQNQMASQDSLQQAKMPLISGNDSLSVSSFPDKFVVLDFWATWTASFSRKAHSQLTDLKKQYPGSFEIIAAVVQDKAGDVDEYISRHEFPFHYVEGTQVFNSYRLPGVPTQLVYIPGGTLHSIFTGSADSTRMDSLQKIIRYE
jgi:thiol-disulfide isomerase/thioredoxin